MGRNTLTYEDVKAVLGQTYEYWYHYYLPDNSDPDGRTEDKIINNILRQLSNT